MRNPEIILKSGALIHLHGTIPHNGALEIHLLFCMKDHRGRLIHIKE